MRFSPSAVDVFSNGCERKWAYQKLEGIQEPDTPATIEGRQMHEFLAAWCRSKVPPPTQTRAGRMARDSTVMLPVPPIHGRIEEHVEFTFGGVVYHGWPDLVYATPAFVVVQDHKSTADLGYVKTPEDLHWDPQRIIYSYASRGDVLARWGYVERRERGEKGKHATHVTEVFATRAQIVTAMEWLHETHGVRMAVAATEPVDARPRNFQHCFAYNRPCPHQPYCHVGVTPGQKIRGLMSMEAIKAKLAAKKAALGVVASSPAPEPAPAAEPEAAPAAEPEAALAAEPEPADKPANGRKTRTDKGKARGPYGPRTTTAEPETAATDGELLRSLGRVMGAVGEIAPEHRLPVLRALLALFAGEQVR